jgi:hypothetical protein
MMMMMMGSTVVMMMCHTDPGHFFPGRALEGRCLCLPVVSLALHVIPFGFKC